MENACPRCQQHLISELAKRWSDQASPVECANGGCLAYVLMSTSSGIGAVTFMLVVGAIVAAVALASWSALIACLCLAIAFNICAWRRAVMVPIPREDLAKEKPANWLLAGIAMVAAPLG